MAAGNTFGATALASYGGFWITFAIVLTPGSYDIAGSYTDPLHFNYALSFSPRGTLLLSFSFPSPPSLPSTNPHMISGLVHLHLYHLAPNLQIHRRLLPSLPLALAHLPPARDFLPPDPRYPQWNAERSKFRKPGRCFWVLGGFFFSFACVVYCAGWDCG
jgi:hypothetical protein